MDHALRQFADWISTTALSNWFSSQGWVIPTSQSIHIVCVSLIFGSVLLISLRLLGVSSSGRPVSQLVQTLMPWVYCALVVLLLTGTLQTIAEPMRQFVTPEFWWKMFMIVIALVMSIWLARTVRSHAEQWDSLKRPSSARVFAVVWLSLWVGIIICGRFIGYVWSFYL